MAFPPPSVPKDAAALQNLYVRLHDIDVAIRSLRKFRLSLKSVNPRRSSGAFDVRLLRFKSTAAGFDCLDGITTSPVASGLPSPLRFRRRHLEYPRWRSANLRITNRDAFTGLTHLCATCRSVSAGPLVVCPVFFYQGQARCHSAFQPFKYGYCFLYML